MTRGRGGRLGSTALGPGRKWSASTPLAMRIDRARRGRPSRATDARCRPRSPRTSAIPEGEAPEQREPLGPGHLLGLAEIARAGRLDQDRRPAEEVATEARGDRLPERLMGVDQVVLGAKFAQGADHARDEAQTEQRAARARSGPSGGRERRRRSHSRAGRGGIGSRRGRHARGGPVPGPAASACRSAPLSRG